MPSSILKKCSVPTNIIKRLISSAPICFSDLIICGGGLIGSTVACSLAKRPEFKNKCITLIESSPKQEYVRSQNYSNRVSAISPFSKNLLKRLGIWKHINRYQEVNDMKVWGIYSDTFLDLKSEDMNTIAYIVENNEIINAVSQELHSLSNLNVLYEKKISNIVIDKVGSKLPKITLSDGMEFHCQLLIGADGVNSLIRKAMNVDYLTWDYNQMAVVATLNITDSEGGVNKTAWQRFLPDGPVALLPLNKDLSSLVWSTTKTKASNLLKLHGENFVDALNSALSSRYNYDNSVKVGSETTSKILNAIGYRLSKEIKNPPFINKVEENSRAMFPLGFGHSVNYARPHAILVGDAAHRVHPLAGQGVNLGFRDIDCLENVLCNGLINGREIGDSEDIKKYETLCQQSNIPVMAFIEFIHRIYTSDNSPLQIFGDACLQLASNLDPLKDLLNKKALFLRA